MNSNEPKLCYEHVFTKYENHKPGSNEYVYNFPEQFNSFVGTKQVALRSITVSRSSRTLRLRNVYFKNSDVFVNLDTSVTLSSNDNMGIANDKFLAAARERYYEYRDEVYNARVTDPTEKIHFGINDYIYEYDYATNTFWLKILKGMGSATTGPSYFDFGFDNAPADEYASADFQAVMGIDDQLFKNMALLNHDKAKMNRDIFDAYLRKHPNVIVKFVNESVSETRIKAIGFKNVWNRDTLFVASTLSTGTEDKFMTLSNVRHQPPKYYEVSGYSQTFSLLLYDACKNNSVEFPNDGRDIIIVEMIIYGYS